MLAHEGVLKTPRYPNLTILQCSAIEAFPYCSWLQPEASILWMADLVRRPVCPSSHFQSDAISHWEMAIKMECGNCFCVFSGYPSFCYPLLPENAEHWLEIIVTVQQTQVLWAKR